ncbi:Zona pellucida sperm-binding protein 3 [Dissostichus eleginoides]|uniref:Zona pellucida sperm-binding protein 3 n=1 Tax=Dissostichus eleginoides TaxID=100907 RepID=A0AAD9FDR8_DISEL|nr:Zona pellucida sperm-binding protein 3 [Dissostichus eleginoides]
MGTQLYLGVIVVMLFATTVANAEIKVQCEKDSISITLTIPSRLRQYAARYFLGNCMPSRFNVLPSGEGKAEFNYKLADCNFKRLMKGKHLIYKNELTFRPRPRSSPAAYVYPIECVYPRPKGWVPPFLNPGSGVAEGRGGLKFHMLLLNEKMTEVAETNVIPLGSFMPIWATVEQKSHQPLLLLMEECVAATTPELQANSNVYPIIRNKGCLLDSVKGNSRFLPRYHSSAIILYLQSFKFGLGKEVYIHCKLLAWDPEVLSESKKACHYVKENERWELLDDPMQSSMCDCCSRTCNPRSKRGDQWESNGFRPKDWYATIYDPVFKTYSLGDLQFNIGLMNEDFSGPAESTRFPLGSIIPIMASVVQNTHQPLLLLLEECVAATTPELYPESTMYPIISNKGCLLESVSSRSKFEPRQKSSEIRLSLQTFTFAMGEEVFIHCKLLAWDPNGLDSTKKACHFVEGHGWELLDNLAQSNLCDCCESTCKSRRQRSVASVGLLWVAFVLLDGDWYVCCKNDGSKQQVQLACKAEANITDNERVIIEELKNSSQHYGGFSAFFITIVAFILPFCERCKCCEEVSCCFNSKHLIEELIFTEEENVLEEVLMKAVKEKLAEEVKEKTRDKPWNEYKGTAKALFDEAMAQLINS